MSTRILVLRDVMFFNEKNEKVDPHNYVGTYYANGVVYNHPLCPDGTIIRTSKIKSVEFGMFGSHLTTQHSTYKLS